MTPDQIKAAKDRATAVVNGFKRVTDQNARDALKLAEACETKDRQIAALKRRMLADGLMYAAKMGKRPGHFESGFDKLFKELGL